MAKPAAQQGIGPTQGQLTTSLASRAQGSTFVGLPGPSAGAPGILLLAAVAGAWVRWQRGG